MSGATQELEALYVRLMGDPSNYDQVLDKAEQDITASVQSMERQAENLIQARNQMLKEGARLTQAMQNPVEQYISQVDRLNTLLREEAISQETYNRAMKVARDNSPAAILMAEKQAEAIAAASEKQAEAEKKLAEATATAQAKIDASKRLGAQVTEKMLSPQEQYAQQVKKLKELLKDGHIGQNTYNRAIVEARKELPAVKAALARYAEETQRAKQITESIITPTERHSATVRELDKLYAKGKITQQTYNRAFEQSRQTIPSVQKAQRQLNADLQRAKQITEGLLTPMEKYRAKLAEVDRLLDVGVLSMKEHSAAVTQLGREYNKVGERLVSVGRQMQGVGRSASLYITAPLTLAAAGAVHSFASFEQAMASLRAASNPTQEVFERVAIAAKDMSKELGINPELVVAGYGELLKAGMTADAVLQGAGKSALQFAKVGEIEVATASVIMADGMTIFNETADRTVDILSAAADSSSISIRQVSEAFSQSAAVAKQANKTLEETAVALGILGNNGVKGSDAGTSLKTMFLRLMAPANKGLEVIEKFDLQLRDANKNIKPFEELVGELATKLGGLDQEAKDNALYDLFGQDAIRAAQIFLNTGAEGVAAFRGQMASASTVATKYDQVMDTFNGRWQAILATAKRIGIAVLGTIEGPFTRWGEKLVSMAESLEAFINEHETLAQTALVFAGIAAGMGPLLIAMGTGVIIVGQLSIAFNALGASASAATVQMIAAKVAAVGMVAASAAAVVGVAYLTAHLAGAAAGAEEATAAMANLNAEGDRLAKTQTDKTASIFKDADGMEKDDRLAYLKKQRMIAYKQEQLLIEQVAQAKQNLNAANTQGSAWAELFGQPSEYQAAETALAQYEKQLAAIQARQQQLQSAVQNNDEHTKAKEMAKQESINMAAMERRAELMEAGAKLTEKMLSPQEEYNKVLKETTELYTAEAISVDTYAAAITKAQDDFKKAQEAAITPAQKLTKELERQLAVAQMSKEEAAMYKLTQEGLAGKELEHAQALQKKITQAEKDAELKEEARKITEKSRTPQEKFLEMEQKLTDMLSKKLISQETYNREIAEGKKEIADAQKKADKAITVKFNMSGIEGLEAGSAEFDRQLASYRHMAAKNEEAWAVQQKTIQPTTKDTVVAKTAKDLKDEEKREKMKEREDKMQALLQKIEENTNPRNGMFIRPANV